MRLAQEAHVMPLIRSSTVGPDTGVDVVIVANPFQSSGWGGGVSVPAVV